MTTTRRPRTAVCLSTLLASLAPAALAGCGLGAGDAPLGVQLAVTADSGAEVLRDDRAPSTGGEDTVLRLLQRAGSVKTSFGGAFVDAIDGRAGQSGGGWFFWVDGVAAERGAASWRLRDGDRVWWDLRTPTSRGAPAAVPAVVGAFPAPLVGGFDGRSATVRVRCAAPSRAACRITRQRLAAVGARQATAAETALPATDRAAPVQVVVGRFADLRRIGGDAALLLGGPARSGVALEFDDDAALPVARSGARRPALGPGTGVVAAVRRSPRAPVWLVTGVDERGVRRAAKALDEPSLHLKLAARVDAAGVHTLPEADR